MTVRLIFIVLCLFCLPVIANAQQGTHGDGSDSTHAQAGHQGQHRGQDHQGQGGMRMSMVRHQYVHANGIDSLYKDLSNPLQLTSANIDAGKALFLQHCASCHGTEGKGDGEAGADLNPAPGNIARFAKMPMAKDDYLLWTVSEGGAVLNTEMPAFKQRLSSNEIWQLVTFLRQM